MPILQPSTQGNLSTITAKLPITLKQEIKDYCEFAKISNVQEFVVQSAEYILKKDKEWIKHRKEKPIKANK